MTIDSTGTPATNRGVHWTIGGIDWISATLRGLSPENVAEATFGGDSVRVGGLMGYSDSLLGVGGIRLLFAPGRQDVHLIVPGAFLSMVGSAGQREVLDYLVTHEATFTRIDLQLTDEREVASPRQVYDALNAGEAVTRAQYWEWIESLRLNPGTSVYVGSKTSMQRLVVYDKTAESDGQIRGVRWELRCRKQAAETLAPQLHASESWGEVWAGRLLGFIDFRELNGDTNSARRPRLRWFEELVQGAEKMRGYPPKPIRTLDDVRAWLLRQVAPSLATVVLAEGGDIDPLLRLVQNGAPRMRAIHRAMLGAVDARND